MQADFGVEVNRVLADSAYTRGENLAAAQEMNIELLGPLAETKSKNNPALREDPTQPVAAELIDDLPIYSQTKRFDKTAFVYDQSSDCYYCPAGKPMPHRITYGTGKPTERRVYACDDCTGCPLADQCVRKSDKAGRELIDNIHEPLRRAHRRLMATDEAKESYKRRQHFGELPFAVTKAIFDLRRFLLRGIEGVGQEWRWASTAFNLKKLMSVWAVVRQSLRENNETATV